MRAPDLERMPDTGEDAAQRLARAEPLVDTPGAAYVERRGIPLTIADGWREDPLVLDQQIARVSPRPRP